ncbi:serine hydrolase domain-containing protein [Paenibacillus agri]|uniref:Beta-lactamase family protein n=1 Tax=Paenibacillus agri TaxID=2744309 RepID=A0A850EL17_9BACL|nr:serine hydrolase domain-containing protein [Paenibacillus agri]NUU60490.1 beta-lactamase family protein [Paenibacillus agri]
MLQEWERNTIAMLKKNDIPGLAAGLSRDGQTLMCGGYGWRDLEQQLPVTAHTTFGLASITKTFTALAIMMLQESGKLSIEDEVMKWLPELHLPPQYRNHIRIRHLLNHTAGLPDLTLYYRMMVPSLREDKPYRKSERLPFHPHRVTEVATMEQFIELFNATTKEGFGPPGINYSYSNEGYMFLDEIVSRSSGQSYIEYVTTRIIGPLGMENTLFGQSSRPVAPELTAIYHSYSVRNWSSPWRKSLQSRPAQSWIHSGPVYGHGHLLSSAADMLVFAELFYQEGVARGTRLVRKESIQKMISGRLGLSVQNWKNGQTLVGHAGGQKGMSSDLYIAVEAKVAAIALANTTRAPVWDVTLSGINATMNRPLFDLPLADEGAFNAAVIGSRLEGDYTSSRLGKLQIWSDNQQLFGKLKGIKGLVIPKLRISLQQHDKLMLGRFPARILLDEDGRVIGISLGPGYYFARYGNN